MKQHINLYTDEFKPRKVILSLAHIILLSVALLTVLALATFGLNMNLQDDRLTLSSTQAKAEVMTKRVAAMQDEVNQRVLDESLVQANRRLNEKVAAREQMIRALKSLVIEDKDAPFSSILMALARQQSVELWLTQIHVGLSGRTMALEGTTLEADAVPEYLQKLRSEPAFVGRNFSLFQLDADEHSRRKLHFELKSQLLSDGYAGELPVARTGVYPEVVLGGQP